MSNNKNIFCPRCMNDITTIGQAINPNPSYDKPGERGVCLVGQQVITYDNLELIDVFKCLKCGHSVSIDEKGEPPYEERGRLLIGWHPLDDLRKKL